MNESNGSSPSSPTLADLQRTAEQLLQRVSDTDLESTLFPFGVTQVNVTVRAGDLEVTLEVAGPDHGHGEDEDWEEDEDLFDEDEE